MKITDLKSAVIGDTVVLRIKTDKGIDGYSQIESMHEYQKVNNDFYKQYIVGCDPTDVEDVMRRIRRLGAFKPWGKYVSSIEIALWDIAGKAAGVPVYKLLGGKVRSQVRVYCTRYEGLYTEDGGPVERYTLDPAVRAESILAIHEKAGFTIVKSPIAFHIPEFKALAEDTSAGITWNSYPLEPYAKRPDNSNGSMLTPKGIDMLIGYIRKVREIVGNGVGLAFDCGPGLMPPDALRLAQGVEDCNVCWLEDTIAGNYTPYTMAQAYRDLTMRTSTNIHTGEQIYLRQNCKELIETQAVDILGPDPADCGGIAELKRIAEYADIHGIQIAPHGVFDGVFGMAALTQVCCTLPQNFIAYEYPQGNPPWWHDIVTGLPDGFFRDGFVRVWDRPGLGVEFDIPKAEKYLNAEDRDFFR